MSKDQKGFVVYGDTKALTDELTDEQVGQLFRGMLEYFVDGKKPKFAGVLKFAWIPIKQQMDRDKEKYEAKCEKNRQTIQEYWNKVKVGNDTDVNKRIQTYTNATNTKTKTDTDTNTKTDTDTTTTTKTDTKAGGGGDCDKYDLWKLLDADGIDQIYKVYPESGGLLLEEVAKYVRNNKRVIKNPVGYVLGYAKRTEWDDAAEHFTPPWEQ